MILTDLKLQKLLAIHWEILNRMKQAVSGQYGVALLNSWEVILNLPVGCRRGVCILVQIRCSEIPVSHYIP